MLSAKRLNERVRHLRERYYTRLLTYLKAFMADGYLPGTVPPRNDAEEYMALAPKVPALVQQSLDQNLPFGRRERSQKELMRFMELERKISAQLPTQT